MAALTKEQRTVNRILGRGLISAEVVAQRLRETLVRILTNKTRKLSPQRILLLARKELAKFEPLLAEVLAETQLAAWVAGLEGVCRNLPEEVREQLLSVEKFTSRKKGLFESSKLEGGREGFWGVKGRTLKKDEMVWFPSIERSLEYLKRRRVVSGKEYGRLAKDKRREVLIGVKGLSSEVQEKFLEGLVDMFHEGDISLKSMRERMKDSLTPIAPHRLEMIYRTNTMSAFSEGRRQLTNNEIVQDAFPYTEYSATHDSRVRPEHHALESLGIEKSAIYRTADHEFWDLFYPPWSYNCRCTTIMLTIERAARKGLKQAEKWLKTGKEPELVSQLSNIPFRPKPDWITPGTKAIA